MKAYLKNYRQSPRKVRLVANLIKGKGISRALLLLETTPKRATAQLKKLIESALSNAKHNDDISPDDLFVKELRVDKGLTMRRYRPRAHGRASRIDKHTSNVSLTLETKRKQGSEETNKQEPVKVTQPDADSTKNLAPRT